jgi:hypothetical protein
VHWGLSPNAPVAGWPRWLAVQAIEYAEGLSRMASIPWARSFLESIPLGLDVNPAYWRLAAWRIDRLRTLVVNATYGQNVDVQHALATVAAYCRELSFDGMSSEDVDFVRYGAADIRQRLLEPLDFNVHNLAYQAARRCPVPAREGGVSENDNLLYWAARSAAATTDHGFNIFNSDVVASRAAAFSISAKPGTLDDRTRDWGLLERAYYLEEANLFVDALRTSRRRLTLNLFQRIISPSRSSKSKSEPKELNV